MTKKFFSVLVVFGVLFSVPFAPSAYAHKDFGPASWQTEDGKWELTITTDSVDNDVDINTWDIYRVNIATGQSTRYHGQYLSARLCNASTGNCTAYKNLDDPLVHDVWGATFTNMKPGTYHVDIRDSESGYYYKGMIRASVHDSY
ncbi:hypothetical protein [Staphylospora marina]|uniref:hypothetical protein n=1 Tax=Staphylospora marina TaxID=2490858 RepID=UPI000F5BADAC|nr:hypothetical protein [Staphylospora marina]